MMDEKPAKDPVDFGPGLKKIRQRRWLLWLLILIYVPAMMVALKYPGGYDMAIKVFIAWIILLCIAVWLAAVIRCPDCGNYFHTNGPTFFPARRCLHCGLHINADKKGDDRTSRKPHPS
ncbi:MAG: hypothetical protein JXO49_08510 [Deltaproteobacteria bacterium]|nr:hypothetical protein [Candidatus Anaeroferrophillus wilburensis]MBN2889369.1 hypothetical protein [Deltaproteobacteria bacterium]